MPLTKLNSASMLIGSVLQTKKTQYTSTTNVTTAANTNKTVDVLAVNITPKSTSSIIKLDAHIFHEWLNPDAMYYCMWFFYRDATKLAAPQAGNRLSGITSSTISFYDSDADSTPELATYSYFDSPTTTSQITYKVGVICHYATTVHINRTVGDTDSTLFNRGISFISAQEIKQ